MCEASAIRVAKDVFQSSVAPMNLETIEHEIENWDGEKLRKLMLVVASLRRRREDPSRGVEFARLIDDNTPDQWATMDDVNKRLGEK